MRHHPLQNELHRADIRLRRWTAERVAALSLAAALFALTGAVAADVIWRFETPGRIAAAALCGGLWMLGTSIAIFILLRRRPLIVVAAAIERSFPELDNHLINRVQFAAQKETSALMDAYLADSPGWWDFHRLGEMRDRAAQRHAWMAVAVAAALLLLPGLLVGPAWPRALRRILLPCAHQPPYASATIINVQPGHATIGQGATLDIGCTVRGRSGQRIYLDMWPAGGRPTTTLVGAMGRDGDQSFTQQISNVKSPFEYRLRAGDSIPTPRYRVALQNPLAFVSARWRIHPPAYMRLPSIDVEALESKPIVPRGATLAITAQCNRAAAGMSAGIDDQPAVIFTTPSPAAEVWTQHMQVVTGAVFHLEARDPFGQTARAEIPLQILPDNAPVIRVTTPAPEATLAAGALPKLTFEVADDFGLTHVRLLRMPSTEKDPSKGTTVAEWKPDGQRLFHAAWTGRLDDVDARIGFRLLAIDNLAPGAPHRVYSDPIHFTLAKAPPPPEGAATNAAAEARRLLASIIRQQQANIARTAPMAASNSTVKAEAFTELRRAQEGLRATTAQLLALPGQPPGGVRELVQLAYEDPMSAVIHTLTPTSRTVRASQVAAPALALENIILGTLTRAQKLMTREQQRAEAAELLAHMERLVKGQRTLNETVQSALAAKTTPPAGLARQQDALAEEAQAFLGQARRQAQQAQTHATEFIATLQKLDTLARTNRLNEDLLAAAEALERKKPAEAQPRQAHALKTLESMRHILNTWRAQEAAATAQALNEALAKTRQNLDKLKDAATQLRDTLREIKRQRDRSGVPSERLEEEAAHRKRQEDAALKLAVDLHNMPNLPVGNELVQDVAQIYEEVKQVPRSESSTQAVELGLQKEDWILKALEKAGERMEEMETWLATKPDDTQRNTEAFDQAELPEIPLIDLPASMEDLIGDLLKEQEELTRQAHDSQTNQGSADMPPGWAVGDGEFVNYSAQGKSGNERPDHRELDGRSLIGRQGMSDGESVAGSGKINEGDTDMDHRMTQDPVQSGQIQLEPSDARAVATGGGKLGGSADDYGMHGQGPHMDAPDTRGSMAGLQALLRRRAEQIATQADLQQIRTGSLPEAIRYMQKAEASLRRAAPIQQVHETQQKAAAALRRTRAGLAGEIRAVGTTPGSREASDAGQTAAEIDIAPARYRRVVSDYFKALGERNP